MKGLIGKFESNFAYAIYHADFVYFLPSFLVTMASDGVQDKTIDGEDSSALERSRQLLAKPSSHTYLCLVSEDPWLIDEEHELPKSKSLFDDRVIEPFS